MPPAREPSHSNLTAVESGVRRRLLLVVESGTDARLLDGISALFDLEVVCRRIAGGVEINRSPQAPVRIEVGPASRVKFALWVFRRLIKGRVRFDLILVQGYALASLACNLIGRLFGTRVVMFVCSPVELYYRCRKLAPSVRYPYRSTEAAGLQALAWLNSLLGQRYFVLSEHLARVVRAHGFARQIEVIPVYGVDTELYNPSFRHSKEGRATLGLPATGSIILFSSRIAPEKDYDTLLRTLKLLRDEGEDVWVVNRSGGFRDFLNRATQLGVEKFVNVGDALNPQNEELAALYRAADVCIQASLEEGLGFSPLEALACGTPVIASAVGGLLETIVDGKTGWTYPRGNARRLASAIREALTNVDEAARRTAQGREMVLERYERSIVFAALKRAVERALKSGA